MKECDKCKKQAITDLNAPNGSRDIPSQSQEFENDGRRHFVGFNLNMTSQTQCYKTMNKLKCNISGVFRSIRLKFCRLSELSKGTSFDFKFRCYSNQNENNKLLIIIIRLLFCHNKKSVLRILLQKMI